MCAYGSVGGWLDGDWLFRMGCAMPLDFLIGMPRTSSQYFTVTWDLIYDLLIRLKALILTL